MSSTTLELDDVDIQGELANAAQLEIGLDRENLERSLYEYTKAVWPLLEPAEPGVDTFIDNWHIKTLCEVLEKCYRRQLFRVIINVPPGTMKSLLVMVIFPTWCWAKNASKRFLSGSHSSSLVLRDNLRARQLVESKWYQERWPIQLMDDQNTKTRYNTTDGGWRLGVSVGGGVGEHPDFILIDDPETDEMAQSDKERPAVNEWYDRTLSIRLGRNPCIILIMQRLHEEDLSGHLLASPTGEWVRVCFPMRFEASRPETDDAPGYVSDPLDIRTQEGELLWPAMFPLTKVEKMEEDLGEYGTAGQLQQRPAPLGGGLFKREWFADKFVDAAPKFGRWMRAYDTAGSEMKGDYTVGVLLMEEWESKVVEGRRSTYSTGRYYIVNVVRGQLGPAGVDGLILGTANLDGKHVPIREEREGGSAGIAQIAARRKLLVGYDYDEILIGVNKVIRSKPFRSQCKGGNVYIVRDRGVGGAKGNGWNREYLDELCGFPTGKHDDQVDASSAAFNAILLEPPPRKQTLTW